MTICPRGPRCVPPAFVCCFRGGRGERTGPSGGTCRGGQGGPVLSMGQQPQVTGVVAGTVAEGPEPRFPTSQCCQSVLRSSLLGPHVSNAFPAGPHVMSQPISGLEIMRTNFLFLSFFPPLFTSKHLGTLLTFRGRCSQSASGAGGLIDACGRPRV